MSHNAAHYSLKYGLIGLLIAGVAPLQAVAQSATPDDTVIKTERPPNKPLRQVTASRPCAALKLW